MLRLDNKLEQSRLRYNHNNKVRQMESP